MNRGNARGGGSLRPKSVSPRRTHPHRPRLPVVKILMLGASCVGKTSLLLQLCGDVVGLAHIATVGVDFRVRNVVINGTEVSLHLWDTLGSRAISKHHQGILSGSDGSDSGVRRD